MRCKHMAVVKSDGHGPCSARLWPASCCGKPTRQVQAVCTHQQGYREVAGRPTMARHATMHAAHARAGSASPRYTLRCVCHTHHGALRCHLVIHNRHFRCLNNTVRGYLLVPLRLGVVAFCSPSSRLILDVLHAFRTWIGHVQAQSSSATS
jgi:hypothetical protein